MGTNLKFFDTNQLDDENTSYTFTSASTSLSNYLWDNNKYTKLQSSGSNDSTAEEWEFSFTSTITVDAMQMVTHNIKNFDIEYSLNNGSTWAYFYDVVNEGYTGYAGNTATSNYFDVTQVTGITDIKLTLYTTIVANNEKYMGQFRILEDIFEISKNPSRNNSEYEENSRLHRLGDSGNVYIYFGDKYHDTFLFTDATDTDITNLRNLKQRKEPFFILPGGGDTSLTQEPFRIEDMFYVNYINNFAPKLKRNLIGIGTAIEMEVLEV